ncbi:MAG TPA: hypothetical protein VF491_21615 [Vicinamibacterales bacterium]|jgi:hypothetical protein
MRTRVLVTALLVVGGVSVGLTRQGRPDVVSGTISRTFSIVANTELTGDVTCNVADGTPCFSFAVPGVELRLNGYTLTGKGDPTTGCGGAVTTGEVGITTNGQSTVVVRGPGLVQRFRNHGVQVAASNGARIEGITVSTNCGSGIFVPGTSFNTLVQENTALRNGSSAPGLSCGGI